MAQPIAQGDGGSFRIYVDDGDGRNAHTADIIISATDTEDTISGSATIEWTNLVGMTVTASGAGVTFTPA
jgi:hypothetical protein